MLLLEFFANLVLSHRVGINGALGWMIAGIICLAIGGGGVWFALSMDRCPACKHASMIPFDPLIIILLTVSLNISEVNGDEVSGSYSYTPDRIDKYTQPGSYSFSGTIDKETLMLNLKAGEWISKPERVLSTDKVADCDFRMETEGNEDDLGKFCVAKIKVIAIEDGLSDEGEQEFDGPTYYAVVPESYLGKTTFKGGGGVYEECSWNYYGGTFAVVAEAEDGKFTESEENDIIKFLSTFRQEYE